MDLVKYQQNIREALAELQANRTRDTTAMTLNEVALVKSRVINTGESSDGGQFNPYSAQYKKLREKRTRPTAYRNFSFTGDMWKKVEPVIINESEFTTEYVVSSTEERAKKLIGYNTKSGGGNFLLISEKEAAVLDKVNTERVLGVLRKHNVI